MHFFNLLFRSNEIKVHGHTMYLTRKGFLEYSTEGIYGKLDTLTVERLIKPGDYVIDVGAAIGYFTLIFARLVGKKGLVISFEPKKDRFEILTKNVKVNNYENVMLENKAILNEGNKSTFYSRDDGIAGLRFLATPEKPFYYLDTHKHTVPTQVSTVSLDEYLKDLKIIDRISFMKIDVDGPELLVLESAQSLLKNKDLKILIEWDQESAKWSCCDPAAMIDLLAENNVTAQKPATRNISYKTLGIAAGLVVVLSVALPAALSFTKGHKSVSVNQSAGSDKSGPSNVVATKSSNVVVVVTGATGRSWVGIQDSAGNQVYSGRI